MFPPLAGTLSHNQSAGVGANSSDWVVITPGMLPVLNGSSVSLLFTPATDLSIAPRLCDGVDGFVVTGRNLAMDGASGDGPSNRSQGQCSPAGNRAAHSSPAWPAPPP